MLLNCPSSQASNNTDWDIELVIVRKIIVL